MKRILCYGDSNTYGQAPMRAYDDRRRLGPTERWPCVMATALGADWTLVEEGLPGRTTVHDDAIEGLYKNGKAYLHPCLESHWPLDAMTLMLGTNDLKAKFGLSANDIAMGIGTLLQTVKSVVPPWTTLPKILVICPPPAHGAGWLAPMLEGAAAKTPAMPSLYREQAARHGAAFFDAGAVAKVSSLDGVHFDADQHRALGLAVAAEVRALAG